MFDLFRNYDSRYCITYVNAYFKYIDILISKDLNQNVQHLLDIADSPITEETTEIFTDIVAALVRIANEDNINEFEELGRQLDNAN